MEIPILVTCLFLFGFAGFAGVESKLKSLERSVAQLDRKTDLIMEHLGISDETADRDLAPVAALLRDGKKMQAIKSYRDITGADLKEAVRAVGRMQ